MAYPDFAKYGACVGEDPDIWFPIKEGRTSGARAKAICAECPVKMRCLEYAVENREDYGIWGGLAGDQRRKLRGLSTRANGTKIYG